MYPISFTAKYLTVNISSINDIHNNVNNIARYKTYMDSIKPRSKKKIVLSVGGGDLTMDIVSKPIELAMKAARACKTRVCSMGNHELEGGNFWAKAKEKAKAKIEFLSANLVFTRANEMEKHIKKSTIVKIKGEKFGFIGISPPDFEKLSFISSHNDFIKVMDLEDSIKAVRQEVKELESKKINKIILLAHTGEAAGLDKQYYESFAQIGGIRVIYGGHDHKKVDKWLISERNEPVKVLSNGSSPDLKILGQDLDSFGIFKAVFNKKGVLIPSKCKNKTEITEKYKPSQKIMNLKERYLHDKKIIGHSNIEVSYKDRLKQENPVGSLAADAALWLVNKETKGEQAQISFINSGSIRGEIPKGNITISTIKQALPFASYNLIKTKLTKKQIIDTLNWGAESTTLTKVSPGIMQVGGMRYTIGKDNKVKDVHLLNKDGSLGERIDIQPDDKEYTVVYDTFLMTGVAGLSHLKKDAHALDVEHFPFTRQDSVISYIKHYFGKKPVEIKAQRIEVELKTAA